MTCERCKKEVDILTCSKLEQDKMVCNECKLVEINTEGYDDIDYEIHWGE